MYVSFLGLDLFFIRLPFDDCGVQFVLVVLSCLLLLPIEICKERGLARFSQPFHPLRRNQYKIYVRNLVVAILVRIIYH